MVCWKENGKGNRKKRYITEYVFNVKITPSTHSSWWRRLLFSSSEDVFNTSSRCLDQDEYIRLVHTSSRRLQDVLPRRFYDVLQKYLQDIFKISSRRLYYILQSYLQGIFETFSRHLQDVFKRYYQVKLLLLILLQYIFKTNSTHFWDELRRRLSKERFA